MALVILAMGMIGLPPTGGFFGKWYIILGALEVSNYLAVGAVLLSTMLTMAYFVKLFEGIFRATSTTTDMQPGATPLQFKLSLGVTSAAILVLGVWSDSIVNLLLHIALPPGL